MLLKIGANAHDRVPVSPALNPSSARVTLVVRSPIASTHDGDDFGNLLGIRRVEVLVGCCSGGYRGQLAKVWALFGFVSWNEVLSFDPMESNSVT